MRERLIQLIKQARTDYLLNDDYTDSVYEFIADRLIEDGVILPPVKLGEAVWYFTSKYSTVIQAAEVLGIYYNGTWWSFMLKLNNDVICEATWGIDEVYTTREAAEAALKARKKQ